MVVGENGDGAANRKGAPMRTLLILLIVIVVIFLAYRLLIRGRGRRF
jgi:hypothetical protein